MVEEVILPVFDDNHHSIVWDLEGAFYSELNKKVLFYCLFLACLRISSFCFLFFLITTIFSCCLYIGVDGEVII